MNKKNKIIYEYDLETKINFMNKKNGIIYYLDYETDI